MKMEFRSGRRSILQWLLSLPTTSLVARASRDELDELTPDRHVAVGVIRFVNTAELWHKLEFGMYVGKTELINSPIIERMMGSEKIEKFGYGKSLFSAMSVDDEVVPGWELTLEPRYRSEVDGAGYIALIKKKGDKNPCAFASDEAGLIYEGRLLATSQSDGLPSLLPDLQWDVVAPLGNGRRRIAPLGLREKASTAFIRVVGLLQTNGIEAFCFVPVYGCQQCWDIGCNCHCSGSVPCCCCAGICLQSGGPGCCNCGCVSCVWCCGP